MATFEYYQQQLEKAKKRLEEAKEWQAKAKEWQAEAKEKLKTFENDAEGGEWLMALRRKARAGRLNDDERDKKRRLEEKATRLEKMVDTQTQAVEALTQAVKARMQAVEEWGESYVSFPLSQVTTS